MRLIYLALILTLFSCNGCRENKENREVVPYDQVMQDLIQHNKKQHEKEIQEIRAYISEKRWPMTETGTGLQYWIYETGKSGDRPKLNDFVSISYTVELLNGTVCYASQTDKPGVFKVGEDNVESGLHEMVLLMHVGDKARVILPSHLAFGLTGDSGKIPQSSPLVYTLELVNINP